MDNRGVLLCCEVSSRIVYCRVSNLGFRDANLPEDAACIPERYSAARQNAVFDSRMLLLSALYRVGHKDYPVGPFSAKYQFKRCGMEMETIGDDFYI